MHNEPHPYARRTTVLNEKAKDPLRGILLPGTVFQVEDWVDRVHGNDDWNDKPPKNFGVMHYQMRFAVVDDIPDDGECVYGKVDGLGHIVHVSELSSEVV